MKFTISVIAVMASMLAGINASPVATKISTTVIMERAAAASDTPHSPLMFPAITSDVIVVEDPETALGDHKHKDKDGKNNECQFKDCKACVHRCGEVKGFSCIYWECMSTVCKNCNLAIVPGPSTNPHDP